MKKREKQEYTEFRKILRECIGDRKQVDFAKDIGISPSYLNKMLNEQFIFRPSIGTLKAISKVSGKELCALKNACGYYNGGLSNADMDINYQVSKMKSVLRDRLENKKEWGSLEEFIGEKIAYKTIVDGMHMADSSDLLAYVTVTWTTPASANEFGFIIIYAENADSVHIKELKFDLYSLVTLRHPLGLRMLYVISNRENVKLTDYRSVYLYKVIDGELLRSSTMSKEERLLAIIFGENADSE